MNALTFLTATHNLPFTILLAMCLAFGVLQLVGLGGEAEHDADLEADADADLHLDHDVDGDADADADHDVEHDSDAEDVGTFSLLAFVGVGKAPMAVVLMLLLGAIGVIGLVLNSIIAGVASPYPTVALVGVLPISMIAGGFISSRISRLIGRALPPVSTTATRAQALVGKDGVVISPFIDGSYGMVRVRDRGGTQINVFATAADAAAQPLSRGQRVTLDSFNETKKQFRVSKQ